MKIIYAIIHEKDIGLVIETLIEHGYTVTRMASTGGFLRLGNITLLIGVEPDKVPAVIALLKECCTPTHPNQYAATIFVVDMPVFRKQ